MKLRKFFSAVLLLMLTLLLSGCGEIAGYDQSGYTPGTTENYTYNSPLADLSCTLSDAWLIYGPENYEAVIGLKQDLEDRQQIEDILKMIIKGLAVHIAGVNDLADGDFGKGFAAQGLLQSIGHELFGVVGGHFVLHGIASE